MGRPFEHPAALIVDDDQSFQTLYRRVLQTRFDVTVVGSAAEALTCLSEHGFQIAIVDVRLHEKEPGNRDGLLVAEHIAKLHPDTRIILVSGFPLDTPEVRSRIEKIRVVEVLDKSAENPVSQLLGALAKATHENSV
jgi:ActR/RegA family two-component response regulator